MSNAARAALAALVVIAAIVAFVLLRPSGDSSPSSSTEVPPAAKQPGAGTRERPAPAPYVPIVIEGGSPVGGVKTIEVKQGDPVRLEFRSDRAGEVHIHGYDKELELKPGKRSRVSFPATIEGVFEVESHATEQQLAKLKVEP